MGPNILIKLFTNSSLLINSKMCIQKNNCNDDQAISFNINPPTGKQGTLK